MEKVPKIKLFRLKTGLIIEAKKRNWWIRCV